MHDNAFNGIWFGDNSYGVEMGRVGRQGCGGHWLGGTDQNQHGWWCCRAGQHRTGEMARQASDVGPREGMCRGAACGPVHSQGLMGVCQLEIELARVGRPGRQGWARRKLAGRNWLGPGQT